MAGHGCLRKSDLKHSSPVGSGSLPKDERDRNRIKADCSPPRRLVAVAMEFAVVETADRDCVFVADLASKRPRLGEANVMGFRGRSAAHNARLGSDELAVLLVAQANGFGGEPPATCEHGP